VSGIGGLAAIETSTTEPEVQLTDLDGNVIGKVSASETATKLVSTERPTEYGVPTTTKPAKYSWLGGELLPTELPSGTVAMGARSYVPQIGRFLQNDPIPGGSANPYAYTNGNPINETDLTGDYVENNYSARIFAEEDNEAIEQEAAREAAAREIAEREAAIAAAEAELQAKETAEQASTNPQNQAAAGPLGGSPGWACGYAATTGQEDPECGGGGSSGGVINPASLLKAIGSPDEVEFCAADDRAALYEGVHKHDKFDEEQLKVCKEFEEREDHKASNQRWQEAGFELFNVP
jgi:RHS repeat-associated protein